MLSESKEGVSSNKSPCSVPLVREWFAIILNYFGT